MSLSHTKLSILVVEDNPGDFILIEEYLAETMDSLKIRHVQTFKEARKILEQGKVFDVILLDLSLPDLSGEPLVEKMVQISGQAPVIVLTGYENQDFGLKTLSLGVTDYLLKDEISPFVLGKIITYSIERNRISKTLKESEKKYREIFNMSPQPMWVYKVESLQFLDVNQSAIDHYGYSRDEFLSMALDDIQPQNGFTGLNQTDEEKQSIFEGNVRHLKKDGTTIDVHIKSNLIEYQGIKAKMVLAEDITDKLAAERAIVKKSNLLSANAEVASALIQNKDWLTVLNQTFEVIGKAVEADRVYYFENHKDPSTGKFLTSQKIEWAIDQVNPQIDNPELQNLVQSEYAELYSVLEKNEVFSSLTADLPESKLKKSLLSQNILSIIAFPIFVDNKFYGFIGFDDCTTERIWESEEIQYLKTIASNISSAVKLRKTTAELKASERRFKSMVQEGADLIAILDEDAVYKYVSPNSKDVMGIPYDEFLGENVLQFIHQKDIDRIAETLENLAPGDREYIEPFRFKIHNSKWFWFETTITNMVDNPIIKGFLTNSRDVTEQIERQEKLRELSLVASKTTDMVVITDNKGYITWVNSAFEKMTGYSLKEINGKKPGAILQGPDTDSETVKRISKALKATESIEETILNYDKSGNKYWLNMSIDPIFDKDGVCTHFIAIERDVTEKIEQEKELRQSLERYDIVSKATSDTIWDLDIKTNQMHYNSNIYAMFGYDKTNVKNVGNWWRNKVHPEDISSVDEALSEVLKTGKERFQIEYRFKAADGSYKHIFDRAFVIKDENGAPIRMIGAMQDVTQQVEEAERLKLLESVVTNTSESVVILKANPSKYGREIVFVNEAFTKMTGYKKKDVIGETLHFLNGPETDNETREELRQAMKNFRSVEVEFINYKKNGTSFWINTSMVPVTDKEGNYTHWVAIGRDITDRKQNEKEIKSSLVEKETLLAEIHHRVKNNLAVVSGMMQLQAFESNNNELQAKLYDSVVRIKTMATVHELLYQSNSFSQLEFSDTLKKLVQNVSETLQTNSNIALDIQCDAITLNINQAIPASLIVNEVITNAYKHAFNGVEDGKLTFRLEEKNNHISIKISDNGVGLPKNLANTTNNSLGVHLIDVLSQQINATNTYKNQERGTLFLLEFEKNKDTKGIGNAKMKAETQ